MKNKLTRGLLKWEMKGEFYKLPGGMSSIQWDELQQVEWAASLFIILFGLLILGMERKSHPQFIVSGILIEPLIKWRKGSPNPHPIASRW